MFQIIHSWLRRTIAIMLVVLVTSCGGEFNPDLDEQEPPVGDGGSGDGGSGGDGNGDGGGVSTIDPTTGSWVVKDEDGDGVQDEDDDFPFDSDKTTYELIVEEEENNLIDNATEISAAIPFRIQGNLPNKADTDVFEFSVSQEMAQKNEGVSFIIKAKGKNFYPTANLFDNEGKVLSTITPSYFTTSGFFKYHFTYRFNNQGTYYLSVSSNFQTVARDYILEVVVDSDFDGVGDHMEYALGSNTQAIDSDNDGVTDAVEIFVPDIDDTLVVDADSDNVPNYLDDDSDNDGLSDQSEGFKDIDGDLIGNFVDMDSDGNSLSDSAESVDPAVPVDSDKDGVADYKDTDDDNDNVFDKNDADRLNAVIEASITDPDKLSIISTSTNIGEGHELFGESLRGYPMKVKGNLAANSSQIVIFEIGSEVYNFDTSSNGEGEITVTLPLSKEVQFGDEKAYVSVYDPANQVSNRLEVLVIDPQVPIVNAIAESNYTGGEQLTIRGWNFNASTMAWIGNVNLEIDELVSSNELKVTLPEVVSIQELQLENGWGKGNTYPLDVVNSVTAQVEIPGAIAGTTGDLYFINADGEWVIFVKGQENEVSLPALSSPQLTLYQMNGNRYSAFLRAPVEGATGVINVNVNTTNYSWAIASGYQGTLEQLVALNGYDEWYAQIVDNLVANQYYLAFDSTDEFQVYMEQLQAIINPPTARAQSKVTSFANQKASNEERELEATITPDEIDDIAVTELSRFLTGSGWDFFYDEDAYGYTNLNNDTQLYLSVAVFQRQPDGVLETTPASGEDDDGKAKVYSHITNLGDSKIVSPAVLTLGGFEFLDKDVALRVCKFADCRVEVITAGFDQPELLTTDEQRKVALDLKVRTILERGVWSFIKAALDASGVTKGKDLGKIPVDVIIDVIFKYYPDVYDAVVQLNNSDGSTSSFYQILHEKTDAMVKSEVDALKQGEFGPVTKVLLAWLLDDASFNPRSLTKIALEAIVEEIVTRHLPAALLIAAADKATLAIPVVGQIKGIVEIASFLDGVATGVGTWVDIATVRSKIDFDISWGVQIKRMNPAIIDEDGGDTEILIEGVGFCIEERWWLLPDIKPEFTFHDFDDPDFSTPALEIEQEDISEDCRQITVRVAGDWLKSFADSGRTRIRVDVEYKTDRASSAGIASLSKDPAEPSYILVGDGIAIGGVNPNPAYVGQIIEVSAIGFSSVISRNRFFISSSSGGYEQVELLEAPQNGIARIRVPQNAVSGEIILEVDVEQTDGSLTPTRSQPYPIDIVESFIQIQYGDNGNFDDDQFAIYRSGAEIDKTSVGQREKILNVDLAPGRHDLELKGLVAPDNIATYYICFSDNVTIENGDKQGRVNTNETSNKNGLFSSTLRITVDSGNGATLPACPEAPSLLNQPAKATTED